MYLLTIKKSVGIHKYPKHGLLLSRQYQNISFLLVLKLICSICLTFKINYYYYFLFLIVDKLFKLFKIKIRLFSKIFYWSWKNTFLWILCCRFDKHLSLYSCALSLNGILDCLLKNNFYHRSYICEVWAFHELLLCDCLEHSNQ